MKDPFPTMKLHTLAKPLAASPQPSVPHCPVSKRQGITLPELVAQDLKQTLKQAYYHAMPATMRKAYPDYLIQNYAIESIREVFSTIHRIPEKSLRLIKSRYYPQKSEFHPPSIRLVFNRKEGDYTEQIHQNIRQSRFEIANQFRLRHSDNPLLDKGSLNYDDETYDATRAFYPLEERLTEKFIYPHLAKKHPLLPEINDDTPTERLNYEF